MFYFVYAIQSKKTGKIYIGQTADLAKRLKQHNDPNCKLGIYTKKNKGPWQLVYFEKFKTRNEAVVREKQLKSAKGREYIKTVISGP